MIFWAWKMQLHTPKLVQFLHVIIVHSDASGAMLKHPHMMLHLGFFESVAWGLKNAIISLTIVVSLPAAWVFALTAGVVASTGEITPKRTTSSLSTLGGEGSLVVGDWNGGKEGWMQLSLVVTVGNSASLGEEGWGLLTVVNSGILRMNGRGLYLIDGTGCSKKVFW